MHIIELKKVKEKNIKTTLELWLMFLKNPESKEVKKRMFESPALKQAMQELEYLSGDPEFQYIVELREKAILDDNSWHAQVEKESRKKGMREGMREGRKEGMREGEKRAKLSIAKEMLKQGIKIEDISKIVKLSIEELNKINVSTCKNK